MNESKSKLLDICSSKFTEDVVFTDKEYKFALNNENIQNLFEILNSFLFKGMLSKVPKLNLFIGSPVELNPKILEYTQNKPVDLSDYFALYQPDNRFFKNAAGQIALQIVKNGIFVNTSSNKYSTFAFAASSLCHEMIHVYDMYFGTLYGYTSWMINNGAPPEVIDYNSHLTKVFKNMQQKFETETNIKILKDGANYSFDKYNAEVAADIKLLAEDADLSSYSPMPFSKAIIDFYKDSDIVQISDDGTAFSVSFGIQISK